MKKTFYLILVLSSFVFILQSCEHKKEADKITNDTIVYDNALDVPVEKLAVIINVDTVSFKNNKTKEDDICK